jgi:hypothetical protein
MTNRSRRNRPAAPKPVREVACAAGINLRELAMSVLADQPSPAPREHEALMRWLTQSAVNASPGIDDREVAEQVVAGVEEMAEAGDQTATAVTESLIHDVAAAYARTAIAMHGARWVPEAPEFPKEQRKEAIASTVLRLTGWPSVDAAVVQAIYLWLFGDEALFIAGAEMRLEAGMRMIEYGDLCDVQVVHPDTGELVVVTRDDILAHAEADQPVLEAAERFEEARADGLRRFRAALQPYGGPNTPVLDALHRAAADMGIDPAGRSFNELASLVVAAAEARAGLPGTEQLASGARRGRGAPASVLRVPE